MKTNFMGELLAAVERATRLTGKTEDQLRDRFRQKRIPFSAEHLNRLSDNIENAKAMPTAEPEAPPVTLPRRVRRAAAADIRHAIAAQALRTRIRKFEP